MDDQCDLHGECFAKLQGEINALKIKLDALCKRVDKMDSHEKRISDTEHDMITHSSRMNGQDKAIKDHVEWGNVEKKEIDKRDKAMASDISRLDNTVRTFSEAVTALQKTVSYGKWAIISGAVSLIILLFTGIGTLGMQWVQTKTDTSNQVVIELLKEYLEDQR